MPGYLCRMSLELASQQITLWMANVTRYCLCCGTSLSICRYVAAVYMQGTEYKKIILLLDTYRDTVCWHWVAWKQIPKLVSHPKLWKQIFEAEGPQGSFSMVSVEALPEMCSL